MTTNLKGARYVSFSILAYTIPKSSLQPYSIVANNLKGHLARAAYWRSLSTHDRTIYCYDI